LPGHISNRVEMLEARVSGPGMAEILYRVDGRQALLTVARDSRKEHSEHRMVAANTGPGEARWRLNGLDYQMKMADGAHVEMGCILCHAESGR
jgi:hypothetical protein